MLSRWFKGLDKDQVEDLKQEFVRAQRFRKRLIEILDEDLESAHFAMRNADYNSASWAYEQAGLVEKTKTLLSLKRLLERKSEL